MSIEQLFFELLRVSIGVSWCLSKTPTNEEWKALCDMAKKQSLVGVCFAGVQKLVEQQQTSEEMLYLTWMGMTAKIQQRNEVVNQQCVEVQRMIAERGCRSCTIKGQRFLLNEIMQARNFSHHDERNKKFDMGSYWQNFFGIIGRNIAYFRFAPCDWLMSPLWRVYHFVWRKKNGYV